MQQIAKSNSSGYIFSGHVIEPKLTDITKTGAAVIVNSVGSKASFRNPIAQAIMKEAGEEVRTEVHRYTPIKPGRVVVTHAGKLQMARYIFHTVITSAETNYYENPALVVRVTTRCVQLADLLDQPTIAIPFFGTGFGRGKPEEVIKQMLNVIVQLLPDCNSLERITFATTNEAHLALFHNLALVDLALARREDELKKSLRFFPVTLYGLVGQLLQKMEDARQSGDNPQELLQQADGLVKVGLELADKLPHGDTAIAGTVQLIIATGGSIIKNVQQQSSY